MLQSGIVSGVVFYKVYGCLKCVSVIPKCDLLQRKVSTYHSERYQLIAVVDLVVYIERCYIQIKVNL